MPVLVIRPFRRPRWAKVEERNERRTLPAIDDLLVPIYLVSSGEDRAVSPGMIVPHVVIPCRPLPERQSGTEIWGDVGGELRYGGLAGRGPLVTDGRIGRRASGGPRPLEPAVREERS